MGSKSSLITDNHHTQSRTNGGRNGGNGKPGSQSLFERLGGARAIAAVVDAFYERVLPDPQLKHYFEYTDINWLKKSQNAFLTEAFGGPARYKGQDMKSAHAGLGISETDFNQVATHLAATLESLGVAPALIEEVMNVAASLATEVVDRKSRSLGEAERRGRAAEQEIDAAERLRIIDLEGQVAAISKSQAVIEFNLDGTVIRANDNFLNTLGYRLEEIQGKHHSTFCDPVYTSSPEYRQFWADLSAGRFSAGEYKQIGKGGKEVWIQASYNPIFDANGKPFKAVQYATDITETVRARNEGAKAKAMLENAPINMMMTDLDLNITYVNPASTKTLKQLEKFLPVPAEKVLGSNIDIFHKVPSYQRGILSNPKNLPHRAKIKIGPEHAELLVSPIYDSKGAYVGPMVTWEVTTEKDRLELEQARLKAMVENAPINMMLAGTDFVINYVNPASLKTLKEIEKLLPVSADKVVGSNIDIFHKNPAHQRGILSNPKNLPHRAHIQIGSETAELLVSPIFDKDGNFMGPMVTWEIITQKLETERKVKEAAEREKHQAEEMKVKVDAMKKNIANLASSSEELNAVSQQMSANSEETSAQATVVSGAAEQVSKNLQTVSTGTEEMMASIKEIAKNANEAAKVATSAVRVAEDTNATVSKLGDSSVEIGKVIKVITSIAQQTNLLALNATIEAARAGEAGKGFAVVANEVKELAKETAKATEEIGQKIQAIQTDSKGAVQAIAQISSIINQINEISTTIASSVEEQTATTTDIGRNVTEAAKGSQEIAHNILGVAQAAQSTTTGAANTQQAAAELSRMATELQEVVSSIKTS